MGAVLYTEGQIKKKQNLLRQAVYKETLTASKGPNYFFSPALNRNAERHSLPFIAIRYLLVN